MRLQKLETILMHEHSFGDPVPDEVQSEIRMLFNEALAGGPNMNGDAGPTLTHSHALDCVRAAKRIAELSSRPNPEGLTEAADPDIVRRLNEVAHTLVGTTEKAMALDFNLLGHDILAVTAALASTTKVAADEPMLTQAEQDELVERINANPNLQPAPDEDAELVERAVQAAIDAGLAVNGEHGVAAARVAARYVLATRLKSDEGLREAALREAATWLRTNFGGIGSTNVYSATNDMLNSLGVEESLDEALAQRRAALSPKPGSNPTTEGEGL